MERGANRPKGLPGGGHYPRRGMYGGSRTPPHWGGVGIPCTPYHPRLSSFIYFIQGNKIKVNQFIKSGTPPDGFNHSNRYCYCEKGNCFWTFQRKTCTYWVRKWYSYGILRETRLGWKRSTQNTKNLNLWETILAPAPPFGLVCVLLNETIR